MSYNLSVCVFIRNTFDGAFCLFEGMHQLLPFADEFIVMDLGSNDGTLETLNEIAAVNSKVKLVVNYWGFHKNDASVFADLANELIAMCQNDNVLYYQSDEIWHEDLLDLMQQEFDKGHFDLNFWRIQYRENFQIVKWYPHPVHRVGPKSDFNFVGDGMNTDRYFGPPVCSSHDMGWFVRWSDEFEDNPTTLPTNEMIMDVSMIGGFLDNIEKRRKMHAPFWHEEPKLEDLPVREWVEKERQNENWYRNITQFNIPDIMKYHLGKQKYTLRPNLLEALKQDKQLEDIEWR